jgi:TonB-linked SusC/RagA family outer membrane protein
MRSLRDTLTRTKNAVFLVLLLFAMQSISAQTRTVSGKVSSDKNEPLSGVTVTIKNSNRATSTNANGTFSITAERNAVLVFSMVGFEGKELPANEPTVNVIMQTATKAMDEVVVVGYGTVKKSDVTGAVVSLKASELTSGANVNVQQMLQGRAAGVQITQKSGEPGSAMSVQIRGVTSITAGNDPLYVIDGMPINDEPPATGVGAFFANATPRNPLNSLNPSDIASIEILKDASATAIYGSRGANGVVLITTKSGSSNKLTINFNSYYGFQKVAKKEEDLNAQQYHDVINAIIAEGGGLVADTVTSNFGTGTDWQSQLYQPASIQSHDLSVAGGAINTKYFLSVGYYDQQGILKNSGTRRYYCKDKFE